MGRPFNDVINLSKAILCHKKKSVEGLNICHCTKMNNLRANQVNGDYSLQDVRSVGEGGLHLKVDRRLCLQYAPGVGILQAFISTGVPPYPSDQLRRKILNQ